MAGCGCCAPFTCCDPESENIFLRLSGIFQCPSRDEHVNGDWVLDKTGPGEWVGVAGTSSIFVQCNGFSFDVQVLDIGNSFLGSVSPPAEPLFNTADCGSGDDGEGGTAEIIGCTPPSHITGACCQGETCSIQTQQDCTTIGGIFIGVGTDCSDNPCHAHGACCYHSGDCTGDANCHCVDLSPGDCATMGGSYTWNGLPCNNDGSCPVGACCAAELGCIQSLESFCRFNCTGSGNNCVYLGSGSLCDPGVCP